MRLISQDRIIDVPYEQASIEVNGRDIYCGYSSIITRHCTGRCFAEYSTKAKAIKAMEMLRKEYLETVYDYRTKPKVFQFPKDEEVEV